MAVPSSTSPRAFPLFWRVAGINVLVLALATLALAISPATVSEPVLLREAVVLVAGALVMVALNLVLVRRALAPLARLTHLAQAVDPLAPGERVGVAGPDVEVAALSRAFDDMLERLERERRESALRSLRATEEERRRIARELHDEIGQLLTALVLQLEGAVRTSEPTASRERLEDGRELARTALEEVRSIAQRLRPEALDDLGLVPALTSLASAVPLRAGLRVEREVDRGLPQLSPEAELVVYRVAQESLVNVVRHAGASVVELTLRGVDGGVELRVSDDGCGFDVGRLVAENGVRGMRERALLVGGRLTVRSQPGRGTEVRLNVPSEVA